jgi:hypothetical protein
MHCYEQYDGCNQGDFKLIYMVDNSDTSFEANVIKGEGSHAEMDIAWNTVSESEAESKSITVFNSKLYRKYINISGKYCM